MKRLTTSLLLFLGFAISLTAQDLDQKVSYQAVAQPVSRALLDVEKLTHLKIASTPSVDREIVFIDVRDVKAGDLLDRLAIVCSGEWKVEGDKRTLIRKSGIDAKARSRELQMRTEAVRAELKKITIQTTEKPKDLKDQAKKAASAVFGGPQGAMGRAIILLANQVDPRILAAIERHERVVFAANPTRMQKPLGGPTDSILANFVREHNEFVAQMRTAEEGKEKTEDEKKMEEFMARFAPGLNKTPLNGNPSKALLIASRERFSGSIQLELRLFDDKGLTMISGVQSLAIDPSPFDFAALAGGSDPTVPVDPASPAAKKPDTDPDPTPLEFSADSLAISKRFRSMANGPGSDATILSDALLAKLIRPDLIDPLAYGTSDALGTVAKTRKLNIVADLPDSLLNPMRAILGREKSTVGGFLTDLRAGKEASVTLADGWMMIAPAKPEESTRLRLDRVALAKFIGAAQAKEVPSLDDFAEFAAKTEDPLDMPAGEVALMIFAPGALSQGFTERNWDMLKLYGLLGQSQRQALFSGAKLPLAGLIPGQTAIVQRLTFGADAHLIVDHPGSKPKEEQGFMDLIAGSMFRDSKDYRDEPTEIMPNGLPAEGYFDLKVSPDHFVIPQGKKGSLISSMGALGSAELAMISYIREEPAFKMAGEWIPAIEKVRIGDRSELAFTFHLAPAVTVKQTLVDDRIDKNATTTDMEHLPEDFRAKMVKRLEAFKKSPFPFLPGMFGGGAPPPR